MKLSHYYNTTKKESTTVLKLLLCFSFCFFFLNLVFLSGCRTFQHMTFTYWWRELRLSETSYIRNSYYTAFSVFSPTLLHHTLFSSAVILLFFLLLLVQFGFCQQLQLSPPCDCCWMPFKGPCEELYVGAWRCQWVCIISPCDQTLWKWIKETVQLYQDFLSQSNALDLVDCKSAPHLLLIRAERERDRWDAEKERWQECLVWYACMGIFVFLYVHSTYIVEAFNVNT